LPRTKEFVLGGSIVLRSRFLFSLVVALFLSTLASANSIPVNMTSLHSGPSVYDRAYPSPNHFSVAGEKATPMMFGAHYNHIYRSDNYHRAGGAQCMSTPEPASLLLLSTGLIGIAGMLRRKLLRG
jgi:hypothetical protein